MNDDTVSLPVRLNGVAYVLNREVCKDCGRPKLPFMDRVSVETCVQTCDGLHMDAKIKQCVEAEQ